MSVYICEKCGCIENTALGGYWRNVRNNQPRMCSECNNGEWHNEFEKRHWTEYGTKELLRLEALRNGSMINATEYLRPIGKIQ
jgi:hypothetical protein